MALRACHASQGCPFGGLLKKTRPTRPGPLKAELFFGSKVPGPPKEPKMTAEYPNIESIGSIGSMILALLEVQVLGICPFLQAGGTGQG